MDVHEKLMWLRQSRILQVLSDEDLAELAAIAPDRRYARGEVIFSAGDEAHSMYLLKQGSVLLSRLSSDGREKTVGLAQGGDVFGELLLAPGGERRRCQAVCWEDALVCGLSAKTALGLMLRKPRLALEMARLLAARVLDSHDEIESLSFDSAESRVLECLLRMTAPCDGAGRLATVRATHEQLARMVGASRETVTGALGRLRRQGLLDFAYGTVTVHVDRVAARLQPAAARPSTYALSA